MEQLGETAVHSHRAAIVGYRLSPITIGV
ncbi:MAG: hypothetical protein RLZZ31_1741, partial [Actinomycetota bacterium]